jgi:hypothetical protein
MYMTTSIFSDKIFLASRSDHDISSIWIRHGGGLTMCLDFVEAEQLIAELTREVNAAKAEAQGVSA